MRLKESAIEKINKWYEGNIWIYDNEIALMEDQESLSELLERVINQYEVRVILIDNLMTALDLEPIDSTEKYEKQSLFMKKLTRLALKYNVLIILVAHQRKNGNSNVNDNVSGTADIANLASVVMSYDRSNIVGDSPDVRKLKITKNRLYGDLNTEGITLNYDPLSKRIYATDAELIKFYSWETNEMGLKEVDSEPLPFVSSFADQDNSVPF